MELVAPGQACHQKRVVEFGEWLCEEVLKYVPHRQWVFIIADKGVPIAGSINIFNIDLSNPAASFIITMILLNLPFIVRYARKNKNPKAAYLYWIPNSPY